MQDIYFCLRATENEHDIIEDYLRSECEKLGCRLNYYRKLKDGHVPMYREVKASGRQTKLNRLKNYVETNLDPQRNPYKISE